MWGPVPNFVLRVARVSLYSSEAMKNFLIAVLAVVCMGAAAQTPQAPEIAAKSYLLLDITAKQVLAAKPADEPVEPASLTKLMTAYLVFDALRA